MTIHDPEKLVRRLAAFPRETEWLEFKVGNFNPESVGKYVSAIANSAVFCGEDKGYLAFGIEDLTHRIVGTSVRLDFEKVGNETYLHWLSKNLVPSINIDHCGVEIDGCHVEILAIDPGYHQPVRFKQEAYIRIDTSLHPLSHHAERERAIWQATSRFAFEQSVATSHMSAEQILELFGVEQLLGKLGVSRQTADGSVEYLIMEELIRDNNQGGFDVTNLLVLSAARDFGKWPSLSRKGVRVISYKDKTKLDSLSDVQSRLGYGITFNQMLAYVMDRIPHKEEMQHGTRETVFDIPRIAVREIVANAIIHQDFTASGDGPVIEIFPDKLKVTNPGNPLIPTDRFIDSPSRSRNSKFGHLMRRLGLCEERGSGIDRALSEIEKAALPPPLIQRIEDTTVVTLYGPKQFAEMTREERVRACYQHACLCFEKNEYMSNASLRVRLGLTDKQYPQVSLVIGDAREAKVIRPLDEDQAKRNARYVPYWA
jgi:ATP-dependent DNA helicase RecG